MSWGKGITGRPLTKAERREQEKNHAGAMQKRIAGFSDPAKIKLLARAIAEAFIARGSVTMQDLTQSGVSEPDAKRLYDQALIAAHGIEPRLTRSAA